MISKKQVELLKNRGEIYSGV